VLPARVAGGPSDDVGLTARHHKGLCTVCHHCRHVDRSSVATSILFLERATDLQRIIQWFVACDLGAAQKDDAQPATDVCDDGMACVGATAATVVRH
jgi:hypothetical protein